MSISPFATFMVFLRETDSWVFVKFRGKVITHEKRLVRLFPLRVMAKVLHRTPQRIAQWERAGLFPHPTFHIRVGQRTRRLYTEDQIRLAFKVQQRLLGDASPRSSFNGRFPHATFFEEVSKKWLEVGEEKETQ